MYNVHARFQVQASLFIYPTCTCIHVCIPPPLFLYGLGCAYEISSMDDALSTFNMHVLAQIYKSERRSQCRKFPETFHNMAFLFLLNLFFWDKLLCM